MKIKRQTKAQKAEAQEFVRWVNQFLEEQGARKTDGKTYDWVLETIFGTLHLSARENMTEGPGSVMGRFDEPDRVVYVPGGHNKYSGKWNHHYFGTDPEDAKEDFKSHILRIL